MYAESHTSCLSAPTGAGLRRGRGPETAGSAQRRDVNPQSVGSGIEAAEQAHVHPGITPVCDASTGLACHQAVRVSNRNLTQGYAQLLTARSLNEQMPGHAAVLLMCLETDILSINDLPDDRPEANAEFMSGVYGRLQQWFDGHRLRFCHPGLAHVSAFTCTANAGSDSPCEDVGPHFLVEADGYFPTYIDMSSLPTGVATALALSLDLLSAFVPLMMPYDALCFSWYLQEQVDLYNEMRGKGLLDAESITPEFVNYLKRESNNYEFLMETDLDGQEELDDIFQIAKRWSRPIGGWENDYDDWQKVPLDERADMLIHWLWAWRHTAPALYRHRMSRFVFRIASRYRRHLKRMAGRKEHGLWTTPEEWQSLYVTLPVYFGRGWEADAEEERNQLLMQVGEPIGERLNFCELAVWETAEILRCMAEGFGLLTQLWQEETVE